MPRPPCRFEREIGGDYTCGHDHCPQCGAHHVAVSQEESVPRCELEGGCQVPLERFT